MYAKIVLDFGRREAPSTPYVRYLVKKVKETGILIDNPKRENFRNWSQLTIQFASLSGPAIDLQKMPTLAKQIIISDAAHFEIVAFGAQKTLTHTLKSRHTQNESLIGADFGPKAIFFRKWARTGRYSQWRIVEQIFVHKNWRGGYWQHLVSTEQRYVPHSRSYTPCSFSKKNGPIM